MNNSQKKPLIAIVRLAYGATHSAHVGDWHARTCHSAITSGRFSGLEDYWVDRMPVTVARNYAVEIAKQRHCDLICMIDADMHPDYIPEAPRFFETAAMFVLEHDGPCMVGAPCVRADDEVCVYREVEDDDSTHLMFESPEIAAAMSGIQVVPAVSLALCIIDMRCFDAIKKPYFEFGYTDESCSEVAYGEESFGVKLTEAGVPVYCAWSCWASHIKPTEHGKPKAKDLDAQGASLWLPGRE